MEYIHRFETVLARHAPMILDPLRSYPLRRAIYETVKKGDVVCDIGSGLGLLSFFALSAGARHVYAIDCDTKSMEAAIAYAQIHGVSDRISFIEGHSFHVELEEKADVIICETIGSAAFDENILATLKDAKKRLLKSSGKIIPSGIELWGAPSSFGRGAKSGTMIDISFVPRTELLCRPVLLTRVKTGEEFRDTIRVRKTMKLEEDGFFQSLTVWPRIEWTKKCVTDASPLSAPTHWKQCVLPVKPRKIASGGKIRFELIIGPSEDNPYDETRILWRIKTAK
jgi:protein arginine N-methyltransferase 1